MLLVREAAPDGDLGDRSPVGAQQPARLVDAEAGEEPVRCETGRRCTASCRSRAPPGPGDPNADAGASPGGRWRCPHGTLAGRTRGRPLQRPSPQPVLRQRAPTPAGAAWWPAPAHRRRRSRTARRPDCPSGRYDNAGCIPPHDRTGVHRLDVRHTSEPASHHVHTHRGSHVHRSAVHRQRTGGRGVCGQAAGPGGMSTNFPT
jgi:hypothetical protein